MITKNYFILGIILVIAIYLYFRHKKSIETFKPKMSLMEAESLNEWNQNAAALLCEMPLDKTDISDKNYLITFCNRMIREKDYKLFSFLAHDKPGQEGARNILKGNHDYENGKIHYGKSKSDRFIKYRNKDINSKTIEYYNTSEANCARFADNNPKAIGFVTYANGRPGCFIKEKMGPTGQPVNNSRFDSHLRAGGSQFSYSMWLKINVINPNWRCVAIRSKVTAGRPDYKQRCPGMWIWPNQTAFHFRLSTNDYWNDGLDLDSGKIPFQRYVHICYTVNGRQVKAYVNGKLEKEKMLSSPMIMIRDDAELYIRPSGSKGFDIAKMRVFPVAIPQKFVQNVLMKETPDSNSVFNKCIKDYIGNREPTVSLMRESAAYCNNTGKKEFVHTPRENNYRMIQMKDKRYVPEAAANSRPPSYKIHNGMVFLSGQIVNMTTTGPIGFLPIEARPKARHLFTGLNTGDNKEVVGRIDVTPEGVIIVVDANKSGTYTLDNIYYPLSQGNLLDFSIPLLCHYVKIVRPGRGILSVAEVQVFDETNKNIALNKDANQSSNYTDTEKGVAGKAVDGNTNTNWSGNSVTHTKTGNDNYLQIDLGGGFKVKRVVVFNRKDCCSDRIAGAKIILLDRYEKEIMYKIWDPNDFKRTNKLTKTLSGRTCQNWQKQRPHRHSYSTPTLINGGAGAIIDRWSMYSKYGHRISGRGSSRGGRPFYYYCPSGIKSYKYNPWGWWGRFSNYGGIGYVKCEDGSRPRGERRSYLSKRPYITNNVSKAGMSRKYEVGDHNYCRSMGSKKGLWCYTTDPRVRWERCGVDGKKVYSTKEKIYPAQKTFNFNMSSTVPTDFAHYGNVYAKGSYKKVGDYVYLSGLVKYTKSPLTKDRVIDILPEECRPNYRKVFNVSCGRSVIRIDIMKDGKIVFMDATDTAPVFNWRWIPLDGIRYRIRDDIEITLSSSYKPYSGLAACERGILFKLNKFKKPFHTHKFTTHGNSTIAMWIRPNRNGRQNPYFAGYAGEGAITIEPSGFINFYYGPGYHNKGKYQGFSTKSRIEFEKWTHIAIVKDLRNKKLTWFINGKKDNQASARFDRAGYRSWGQSFGSGYVNKYSGKMEGIRVYNRALDLVQVQSLMEFSRGEPPNYGPPMISEKNGLISLSGVAKIEKNNEYLGNLDEKFRPNSDLYFHTNQNGNSVKVHITQTGDINLSNVDMDEGLVSLDGIMYMKNK